MSDSNRPYTVATMDTLGYINDQVEMAMDRHLTYWFACRKNQSKLFGDVNSFEYILSQYQGNMESLADNVKIYLEIHFKELFGDVSVNVDPIPVSPGSGKFNLNIAVLVNYENVGYDLSKAVIISGSSYKLVNNPRAI